MKWCPKYTGSEISDDYAYLLGALRDACVYLPEYDKVLRIRNEKR
jgi:hypothetical protein